MIISQIANLIEEGTKDEEHAFDEQLLPQAEKILLTLVENTESDLSCDSKDLITSTLNTPKGKIFSAMINYSLRYARLYYKEEKDKWAENVKTEFTQRLNRNIEPSIEYSVILGQYLPNLYYLNKKWVEDNINQIFIMNNEAHWRAAITGYLFYSSKVYRELYFLLREHNHYDKGIVTKFENDHTVERLVQHICLGYIEDWEKLEDKTSLITKLIENNDTNQLSAIEKFFWMLRDKLTDKKKEKVKPLWRILIHQLSTNCGDTDSKKIIAKLSKWLCLVDEIDEEIEEWLKLSAKYQVDYNTTFFIEYLLKHIEQTPNKVGNIYLEILYSNIYPEYKKENIRKIVERLYALQEKAIADKICNLYGARGYDFLKDIFEKNRDNN